MYPVEIKLSNISEVRMGSPYNMCDIEIISAANFQLPKSGWQDKYAWSEDFKKLALIRWDFTNNEPGFRLYIVNFETNLFQEFSRSLGLPKNVSFPNDDRVVINKFYFNKDISESENYTDEYSFGTVMLDVR